jgi:RNA polymerase sigma factor for flagellar operon FliA
MTKTFALPPLEKLIEEFLPTINYYANRYAFLGKPVLSKEDLVSAGVIGLIEAYKRYNPSKKVKFRTYAEIRIKGAILDEIRKFDIIPRSVRDKANELEETIRELYNKKGEMPETEEIAEALGISLDEYYKLLENLKGIQFVDLENFKQLNPDYDEDALVNLIASNEDVERDYILKDLVERLEKALEYLSEKERLVLALYYHEGLTMKEVANVLGYTESRISQIHNQAIMKLRAILKQEYTSSQGGDKHAHRPKHQDTHR